MRLFVENRPLRLLSLGMPLVLFAGLSACGAVGGNRPADELPLASSTGPAADYPIVIGQPYTVEGLSYTPADVWNYDEVGFATLENESPATISGAHHTLPLPSYVEVTSLQTGRTILLRLERRGPMDSTAIIALSSGAAAQLEMGEGAPVRVRRVNPPEQERAALRSGERAPLRMDTPASLVEVLRRKLPENGFPTANVASTANVPETVTTETRETPSGSVADAENSSSSTPPEPAPTTIVAAEPVPARPDVPSAASDRIKGTFVVQAGSFSTRERAERVATALGGTVSKAGSYYRVRTGPFSSRSEAEASLAKVRAAGYSDARIY